MKYLAVLGVLAFALFVGFVTYVSIEQEADDIQSCLDDGYKLYECRALMRRNRFIKNGIYND